MSEVPLLLMHANDHVTFVEQVSNALGGTVIYASQSDFVEQALATLEEPNYLLVVIDQPLVKRAYKLVHAYLIARDIMGADMSALVDGFNVVDLHPRHRMALIVDQAVLGRHENTAQSQLRDLCTVIAVS
jgi:hypothetical protein